MKNIVLFLLIFVVLFCYIEFENFGNMLFMWINFALFIIILFYSMIEIRKFKSNDVKNDKNIYKFIYTDMDEYIQKFDKVKTNKTHNKQEIVDIFERLDFVFLSFFEMSSKNKVSIIFDYDRNLPNIFSVKIEEFIVCLVSIVKFLQDDVYAKEMISIKMQKDGENEIETFFRLDVKLNKMILQEKINLVNEAMNNAEKSSQNAILYNFISAIKLLDWNFNFMCEKAQTKFSINGKFDTQSAKFQGVRLEFSTENVSALIFSTNVYFRNILEEQIKNLSIDAKICSDFKCVTGHISDAIYAPFMLFIWIEDYNKLSENELNLLQEFKLKKGFFITLIIANKNQNILSNYINDFFLVSPYTPNILTKIINQAKNRTQIADSNDFLGGLTPPRYVNLLKNGQKQE